MPSRLDALRARLENAGHHYAVLPQHVRERATASYLKASMDDLTALLAVVEAAQDCVTPCSVDRSFCFSHHEKAAHCSIAALGTALAALTTEEE